MTIRIDLRDLTEAHLAECLPHIGQCRYSEPCIIGTLIPADERARLDPEDGSDGIEELVRRGVIEIPNSQLEDAAFMQARFDGGDLDDVVRAARRWIARERQP